MTTTFTPTNRTKLWPWLAIGLLLILTAIQLRIQGRLWICSCGDVKLWTGDTFSAENSQHIADPYAFTHVLHGFVFFWLLAWLLPRVSLLWRLWGALLIEAIWEVAENTEFVIQRYRETTAALGYEGDSIVNSVGDILFCAIGFAIAHYLGFRRTLLLFLLTEVVLIFWIKDSLLLNVIMLLYPIDAIREWQVGM